MPQCAVIGWPGQTGQTSLAALSQTVKTKSSWRRAGPGEFVPALGAELAGVIAQPLQQRQRMRIDLALGMRSRPNRRGTARRRSCPRSPRPGWSAPNCRCRGTAHCIMATPIGRRVFGRTAGGDGLGQRGADFGVAAAAILGEEQQQRAHRLEIGGIDDRASVAPGRASIRHWTGPEAAPTWCWARSSSLRAMSPAAMPSGPAFTSRRKTSSRPSWAKADRPREGMRHIHISCIMEIMSPRQMTVW